MDKFEYESPALTVVGSLAELTEGASTGTVTDKAFPVGTPINEFTFAS